MNVHVSYAYAPFPCDLNLVITIYCLLEQPYKTNFNCVCYQSAQRREADNSRKSAAEARGVDRLMSFGMAPQFFLSRWLRGTCTAGAKPDYEVTDRGLVPAELHNLSAHLSNYGRQELRSRKCSSHSLFHRRPRQRITCTTGYGANACHFE